MVSVVDVIIIGLIGVDLLSLSLVSLIYRWARHAVRNIRAEVVNLLTEESEESDAIAQALAKGIWKRINASLNMNKIPRDVESMRNFLGSASPESGEVLGENGLPLKDIAGAMGINDPGFLKYLPLIMKFLNKSPGSGQQNINSPNDSW